MSAPSGPRAWPGSGLVASGFLLLTLAGCISNDPADADDYLPPEAAARIDWTEYGIPHITARDWHGLGLGYGYAVAQDALCVLAEEFVTVRGDRSITFGRDNTTAVEALDLVWTNAESDAFYRLYRERPDLAAWAAHNTTPETEALLNGMVAGYNRYVEATPVGQRPDECDDEPWVRSITRADMDARILKLQLFASGLALAPYALAASPPGAPSGPAPAWNVEPGPRGLGSNAYAFGYEMTGDGGLLMGNPHFPWNGAERFHQFHLTIPGTVDVMGASLLGIPIVLIGFNQDVAWSHTVSTAWRFTLYELRLDPRDPTAYVFDGATRSMESVTVRVPYEDARGEVQYAPHTFWLSHYGPIVEVDVGGLGQAQAGLSWETDRAYTFRDANAENDRILEQFLAFNTARSLEEFEASLTDVLAIPWVNTVATGRGGQALYADVGVVPNVPPAVMDDCNTVVGRALLAYLRLPVLDGSTSDCDWVVDAEAVQAGALPARLLPRLVRSDYVLNSNDSHWLANADKPLEGYSILIGDERTERNGRTRSGLSAIAQIEAPVTSEMLWDLVMDHPLYYPTLVRPAVDSAVCGDPRPVVTADGRVVDLADACAAIRASGLTASPDDVATTLWERFWQGTPKAWTTPFDADDPVNTPAGFVADDPSVRQAFAEAVVDLQEAGIPVDEANRQHRGILRDGRFIATPGASGSLGSVSALSIPFSRASGLGEPIHGNSHIQVIDFTADRPVAHTLLTYSQSPHLSSSRSWDQTERYAESRWVTAAFTRAQIEADPELSTLLL